jgi:hypothetical protein
LIARIHGEHLFHLGEQVTVQLDLEKVSLFDVESEKVILKRPLRARILRAERSSQIPPMSYLIHSGGSQTKRAISSFPKS